MSNDTEAAKKLIATYGLPGDVVEVKWKAKRSIPEKPEKMRVMMLMFAMWDHGIKDIYFGQHQVMRLPGKGWYGSKSWALLREQSDDLLDEIGKYLKRNHGVVVLPTLGLKNPEIVKQLNDE